MPPRSATRKKSTPASAKAKKSTLKSKQSVVESTPVDQEKNVELAIKGEELEATTEDSSCNNQREGVSAAVNDGEGEQAVTGVGKINPGFVDANPGFGPMVKEGAVEEERDVKGVKGDQIKVTVESFVEGGERVESVEREGGHEKNDNVYAAEGTEKCDNAAEGEQIEGRDGDYGGVQLAIIPAEENGAGGEQNEGRDGDNDGIGTQLATIPELYSSNKRIAAAQIGDAKAIGDKNSALVIYECGDGKAGDEVGGMHDTRDSEEDDMVGNEDEEHTSVFFDNHFIERRKEKNLQIFIGRLDKGAVEDDLIKVFGKFGEIRSVRLARNPTTNRSKGYAFIKYATVEQAKDALSAFKDGIQVGGKHAKISASQDNDTLYMGNICKLWTKERVLEALKSYGIEDIEEIHLPNDPQKEGKIRGFALLEFSTHSDALAAFQRLRKPDAVFGRDRSAKVAFAQTPMHPNEEVLSQVKTVYVEGLTDAWNERKLKENYKQFGEVVKVKLSRNLGTRRKDYGFVTFSSRESALACIEGINNGCIGEGDVKVKASIAMPHSKGRLQKQGIRGGFKVTGFAEGPSTKEESGRENKAVSPKMEGHAKSKKAKKKAKMLAEEKGKALCKPEIDGSGKPNKHQTVTDDQFVRPSSKLEKRSRKRKSLHSQVEGRGKTGADHGHNDKRLKRQMGNKGGRKTNDSRKPKRHLHGRKGSNYGADSIKYRNPSVPGLDTSSVSHQSHAYATTMSGSKRPYADMEPHAGYLEPVAQKQVQRISGYIESPFTMHYQPLAGYQESSVVTQSQPQTGYHEPVRVKYSVPHVEYLVPGVGTYGQPPAGYLEPAVGRQSRTHAVYSESAVPNYSHDPYLRRGGEQDLHASSHSAYGSGYSLPPSYVPSYPYVGYEGGSSVSGHYQSSGGAHLPRRAYY
ncbi:uncharacterized protein LOC131319115 isoform X4 [Rhododendron vialii]|uniref:uncharacterized protein LOC131319115 isoform X4 n=1 Tax=Rhododendron vialii TaxID=182163 RepID=UPI00265DBF48|nr:uncharacterized protein LOC131319115 isoform X4 [Rhododendron vialii]